MPPPVKRHFNNQIHPETAVVLPPSVPLKPPSMTYDIRAAV
jgi:hypothetical protein